MKLNDDLLYMIFSVVEEIPEGNVSSYGQIASLIGCEKNSRLIGKALGLSEFYGKFPCHRVVNSAGRLVPGWDEQKDLLLSEGVSFKSNGCVDMKKYKWQQ